MKQEPKQFGPAEDSGARSESCRSDQWMVQELEASVFQDVRLGKRFRRLVEQFAESAGKSIPWACQDWASTKAAYRFFSNDRVGEEQILAGHFQSTRERLPAGDGPIFGCP